MGFKNAAQRKAVWASKNEQKKGSPAKQTLGTNGILTRTLRVGKQKGGKQNRVNCLSATTDHNFRRYAVFTKSLVTEMRLELLEGTRVASQLLISW